MQARGGGGFVAVGGGVVSCVNGGEPVGGCDLVSLLVFARSRDEVKRRVRDIGLWSPYVMDRFGDLENEGGGGRSRPSAELARPTRRL